MVHPGGVPLPENAPLPGSGVVTRLARGAPPESFFLISAIFHYLGPAFAVMLFARIGILGVLWIRIAFAAVVLAAWRRPWRSFRELDRSGRRLVAGWGAVLAVMNTMFYHAIDRIPLGTTAAIEFVAVLLLAAVGTRTLRNTGALAMAAAGVYLLTEIQIVTDPLGVGFAFANAALFAAYIVLGHRVAQAGHVTGIDGLAVAMLTATVVATPIGGWAAIPSLLDPITVAAGLGVAVSSSVIPYAFDQLAMARMQRATYALLVSLFPATAVVIGIIVLRQVPTWIELVGVGLVAGGVLIHREQSTGS